MSGARNIASEIAQLRRRVSRDLTDGNHVTVTTMPSGNTDVRVEHVFPKPPMRVEQGWWRVTSAQMRLLSDLFEPTSAVALVNRLSAQKDRVRVLHAVRVNSGSRVESEDVYASVAFHIDERHTVPVVLRAVALRSDDDARHESVMLAAVLLEHLRAIDGATWQALTDQQRTQAKASEPRPSVAADDKDVIIASTSLLSEWGMQDRGAIPHMNATGRTLRYT